MISKNNKIVPKIIGLVVLAGLAWFGVNRFLYSRVHEYTDDAFIEGHVIPLSSRASGTVLKVAVEDNQEVKKGDLLVELDPRDFEVRLEQARAALRVAQAKQKAASINADYAATISTAGMDEASAMVSKARSAVNSAKAQVEAAKSRIEQIIAQKDGAKANAEQAAAEVVAWEAEANRVKTDLTRYQDALKTQGVSPQQLDQAKAAVDTAEARLDAARKKSDSSLARVKEVEAEEKAAGENLKQAQAQVAEAKAGVAAAKGKQAGAKGAPKQVEVSRSQAEALTAEIELAQAKVKQAELELSYAKVYAPQDGRAAKRSAEVGAFVQIGQPLMALIPEKTWVVANFKESQILNIHPGQQVKVSIDAYPGLALKGHVDSIQAGTGSRFSLLPPENATGNYVKVVQRLPVKIVLDEEPPQGKFLALGMSVVPEIDIR